MKKIFLIIIISTVILNAQQNDNNIILKLKGGLTFSGLSYYSFHLISPGKNSYTIYPGYLIGIGIEYDNLIKFNTANLGFDFEASYGEATTGEVNFGNDKAKFETTSSPLLMWIKFKTQGQIVPFLKVGLGADNSTLSETFNNNIAYNFKLKDWFFVWGIGGGIEFNLLKNIRLSVFADNVIKEKWFKTKLKDGRNIDFSYRNSVIFCGVECGYFL